MLISILLTLTANRDAVLPAHLGRAHYAETLKRIGQFDARLAEAIHVGDGPKPITCSGLWGATSSRDPSLRDTVTVHAGARYTVRITGLTGPVSRMLLATFVHEPPPVWALHNGIFSVDGVCCNAQRDPWSGATTYEELAAAQLLQGAPRFSRKSQASNGMKIRIPVGLTGKEHPSPGQEFARSSHHNEFFGFAAPDQALVEGMQRILTMNGTESAHVEQTAEGGVAHFGDSRTPAYRATALVRLGVEADQCGEAFGGALTGGEGLPAVQLDQEGQDDFGANAGQGQEALGIVVQLRMLAQVLGNRSFNLLQSFLQGLEHLLQIGDDRRRNAGPPAQGLEAILFLLHHLLQVVATLQQALQLTHLNRQRALGRRLLGCAIAGQPQRILTVGLGSLPRTFGPLPHLAGIGQTNRPLCFMGISHQRQFIATCRFDDPLHRRRTAPRLLGLHLGGQRRKASRFVGELAQEDTLALPQRDCLQVRFGHIDTNPQRRHDASCVNRAPTAPKGCLNVRPEDPALPGIRVYFPLDSLRSLRWFDRSGHRLGCLLGFLPRSVGNRAHVRSPTLPQWLEAGKGTPIWATSFPLQGHHRVFPCHFYDTNGHPPPRQVTLEFASPTAFKSAGLTVPVPMPNLVFGSLVERWNAFSPVTLSPEMRRFGEEMVALSRYRLESRVVEQKNNALRIGGVGQATYVAVAADRYWLAVLQMLADFALYSGVGVQTATGMGQVRRVEKASRT